MGFRLIFIVFFGILICPKAINAQTLSGKIADDKGNPIPFASIYVKESKTGTMTNDKGEYGIKLSSGNYTIIVSHINFETKTVDIIIDGNKVLNINPKPAVYVLNEVVVTNPEDRAKAIMRRAIGMAPYYNEQLLSYKAKVYIKGTLRIDKISGAVKMMAKKSIKETGVKENEKYLTETINEIEYNNGNITHRIISENNTFPPEMDAARNLELGLIGYNIYDTDNRNTVSPLSSKAFSYYRFLYEGSTDDNDKTIYKIKVIPKYKNNTTMSGYVYVTDGLWNIRNLDLTQESPGVKSRIKQNYVELETDVFVVSGLNLDAEIGIMGNKAAASYVNSIKYDQYKVNPLKREHLAVVDIDENVNIPITVQSTSEKTGKILKEIEKLSLKENMRSVDAAKMAKLIKKKEKEEKKTLPDSLRIKRSDDYDERYKVVRDSASTGNDSRYWDSVRAVPLLPDEVSSYKRYDSLKSITERKDSSKKETSIISKILGSSLSGRTFRIDTSLRVEYGGLLNIDALGFNSVDGFRYKQTLSGRKEFGNKQHINVDLTGGYAFARKSFFGTADLSYLYNTRKQARIKAGGGYVSRDFNTESGIPAFDNMIWTLFARQNRAKYFNDSYVYLNHSIELFKGFVASIDLAYHIQRELYNNSDYSFFFKDKRELTPNIPRNIYTEENPKSINSENSATVRAMLRYTPGIRYYMRGGERLRSRSDYPTFEITWKKGIPGIFDGSSDFDFIQAEVRQRISFGFMQSFSYKAKAGMFYNNKSMHFSEFAHFDTKPYWGSFSGFDRGVRLQPVYSLSTDKRFVTADLRYSTPFLFLKYLPLLNRTMVSENIYSAFLSAPHVRNYIEVGYGLGNIFLAGNLGIFAGFSDFKYRSIGFKMSFNIIDGR